MKIKIGDIIGVISVGLSGSIINNSLMYSNKLGLIFGVALLVMGIIIFLSSIIKE